MNYTILNQIEARNLMNRYGSSGIPFVFFTDFMGARSVIYRLSDCRDIQFNIRATTNITSPSPRSAPQLTALPIDFNQYRASFARAQWHLQRGESYLLNLTFRSRITNSISLKQLFDSSHAPYRLYVPGLFTVFSPESFVQISQGQITTRPMKGTISAQIRDAANRLINDKKEMAEHCTIVDLLRNDLSMVAHNVQVEAFRYLETIPTHYGAILQTSSKITGQLPSDYQQRIGDILYTLLPAGSISGAPKAKTVEIIQSIEEVDRGFYTGICGIYDGTDLDSGVMIRYIAEDNGQLWFHSGGGITAQSNVYHEYQELIDKIYVPIGGIHSH